jgi:hypothetical protein
LSQDLGILGSRLTVLFGALALESQTVTLPLQHDGCHKALNLGSLELGLLAILDGKGPLDDVLANVVVLGQVKQLADLGGSLGPESAGNGAVGKAGDLVVALLDDDHREDREVAIDDATTHRLTLALSGTTLTVARVALGKKEPHTALGQHTLLHGKTLLVVSSSDA